MLIKADDNFSAGRIGFGMFFLSYGIATYFNAFPHAIEYTEFRTWNQQFLGISLPEQEEGVGSFEIWRLFLSIAFIVAGVKLIKDESCSSCFSLLAIVMNAVVFANPMLWESKGSIS